MAQGLRLNIIAEGVESPAQLNYLRALGCNTVQGYLFGRPMPMKDVMRSMCNGPSVGAQYAIPFAANN
jgi:EAL domain-containing protein (putative c-di-GMP-specific phosphodiesterase class I)